MILYFVISLGAAVPPSLLEKLGFPSWEASFQESLLRVKPGKCVFFREQPVLCWEHLQGAPAVELFSLVVCKNPSMSPLHQVSHTVTQSPFNVDNIASELENFMGLIEVVTGLREDPPFSCLGLLVLPKKPSPHPRRGAARRVSASKFHELTFYYKISSVLMKLCCRGKSPPCLVKEKKGGSRSIACAARVGLGWSHGSPFLGGCCLENRDVITLTGFCLISQGLRCLTVTSQTADGGALRAFLPRMTAVGLECSPPCEIIVSATLICLRMLYSLRTTAPSLRYWSESTGGAWAVRFVRKKPGFTRWFLLISLQDLHY
uniref:Uncharacterized protein n=1 Tax=Homo sapiens TaxID=9606 RepID=O43467_HUMAN|nr:unknown protein [Homo sapiens]